MIYQAINSIKNQLKTAITATEIGSVSESTNGTGGSSADPDILISLINIEENRISRDPKNYVQAGSQILLKNPAVHLNLTLLFTAIKSATAYEPALESLQKVILFFQGKYVFDQLNTPDLDPGIEKLILEMVSLNMEQLNHIWSILGGKYHPSVVYRVRMITIDSVSPQGGMVIKEIEANYHEK